MAVEHRDQRSRLFRDETLAPWLGINWELGAEASFDISVGEVSPFIAYSDNHASRVLYLKSLFQGCLDEHRNDSGSSRWLLKGNIVPVIAWNIKDFAPSLGEFANEVAYWESIPQNRRLAIAKSFRGRGRLARFNELAPDNYENLVGDARWIAGMLDGKPRNRVRVNSSNKAILHALQSNYGGKLGIGEYKRTSVSGQTQVDPSWFWDLAKVEAEKLFDYASPFFRINTNQTTSFESVETNSNGFALVS